MADELPNAVSCLACHGASASDAWGLALLNTIANQHKADAFVLNEDGGRSVNEDDGFTLVE